MGCFGSDFKDGTPDHTAQQREQMLDLGSRSCAQLKEAFYLARDGNGMCSMDKFQSCWDVLFSLGLDLEITLSEDAEKIKTKKDAISQMKLCFGSED